MVSEVSEDDANALLRELREISERHSKCRNCQSKRKSRVEPEEDSSANNVFLRQTDENRDLNQYWYSKNTIETLCHAMRESLLKSKGRNVAFLSTPSLFFSLSQEEQENCVIFDVSLKIVRPVKCLPIFLTLISFYFVVRYFVGVLLGIPLLRLQPSNQHQRLPHWHVRPGHHRPSIHIHVGVGKVCNHGTTVIERQRVTYNSNHCR